MKSRINFYSDEFKPENVLITLRRTLFSWVLLSLLLILTTLSFEYFNQTSHTEANQLKAKIDQHKQAIQLAQQNLQRKREQSTLVSRIKQKQQELKEKEQLLASLDNRFEQEPVDYEQVMIELATHVHSDVWLTEFHLSGSGLTLNGLATDGSAIPVWFAGLNNSYYFSNKAFSQLEFDEQGEAVLFQIATQYAVRGK